jgi:hypothetical protein
LVVVPGQASASANGALVTLRKLSFYPRRIEAVLTFENHGDGLVTFLPLRRSVLKDDTAVYRVYETRDWLLTDRQLFLGLELASPARYTGVLNFETDQRLDDRARTFELSVAPALREAGDAPFSLDFPPLAVDPNAGPAH